MIFLIALVLSFIGSLPFGMINMAVAHTAIRKGVVAGIIMGMGAAIVEFFQVWVALKFTWLFAEGGTVGNVLQVVAIGVFFAAGTYFLFFAKAKRDAGEDKEEEESSHDFFKGMGIGLLNLMVIPYWIFYGTLLTEQGLLERDNTYTTVFAAGAAAGAFGLLVCYAFLGAKILKKSESVTKWVNKFIGVVLMGFGLYQMAEWLNG